MKTVEKFVVARTHCFLLLSALFLLAAMPCWAQDKTTRPAPGRIGITFISVKPDMVPDFENMLKTEYNPAITKGGAKWNDVWQTAAFGTAFDFVLVTPIDNFAQYDSPSPLMKGLGEEGSKAFFAKASKMINGLRSYAYETRPDLSYEPKMTGPPKMAVVTMVSVAPGRTAEYENFIKNDLLPVIKQSGIAGYWVSKLQFGGDANQYLTVALHENFAELEKGPPSVRVLGLDGSTKLFQKLPAGVVVHQERSVSRFVPGLSYRPAATTTAK